MAASSSSNKRPHLSIEDIQKDIKNAKAEKAKAPHHAANKKEPQPEVTQAETHETENTRNYFNAIAFAYIEGNYMMDLEHQEKNKASVTESEVKKSLEDDLIELQHDGAVAGSTPKKTLKNEKVDIYRAHKNARRKVFTKRF